MRPQGFATLSPERLTQVSRKGGKSAHARGAAHEWTSDEARAAGSKGGKVSQAKRALECTCVRSGAGIVAYSAICPMRTHAEQARENA